MIIVVIVIALGMLFWQNIRDEPMIDASGAVSDAISENAQQPADSQNLLSIELSNWGVDAKYKDNGVQLNYEISASGNEALFIGSELYNQQYCKPGASGLITRYQDSDVMPDVYTGSSGMTAKQFFTFAHYTPDDTIPLWKKIGDYYYMYVGPHSACTEDKNDYELRAINSVKEVIKNLGAAS